MSRNSASIRLFGDILGQIVHHSVPLSVANAIILVSTTRFMDIRLFAVAPSAFLHGGFKTRSMLLGKGFLHEKIYPRRGRKSARGSGIPAHFALEKIDLPISGCSFCSRIQGRVTNPKDSCLVFCMRRQLLFTKTIEQYFSVCALGGTANRSLRMMHAQSRVARPECLRCGEGIS